MLILLIALSCGSAYALPQDWPCKDFELQKCEQTEKSTDYIVYCGKDNDYALKVNVFWQKDKEADDCGTAGCDGTIKNLKTEQEENLRFFCKTENNYNIAKCNIRVGEEYILHKVTDDYYQVNLCSSTFFKYVNFNECSECMCIVHDSRKKGGDSDFYMGCRIENSNKLHCMTGNIYEEKYDPTNDNDFKNCISLRIR